MLIAISSILIKLTYPQRWIDAARAKVQQEGEKIEEDFDWKERLKSKKGWQLVGHKFVMDWKMVWDDILIGFTIAGFVAVMVPTSFWTSLFLVEAHYLPGWPVNIENVLIVPFVAAATFIGFIGNIPLATVLDSTGVLFAGIMVFIYSDLMVPHLVHVNARYYGWKVALYIAAVMFVSIVITALVLNGIFSVLDILPESQRTIAEITQFKIDYTFWMNIVFTVVATWFVFQHKKYLKNHTMDMMDMESGGWIKRLIVNIFIVVNAVGLFVYFWSKWGIELVMGC